MRAICLTYKSVVLLVFMMSSATANAISRQEVECNFTVKPTPMAVEKLTKDGDEESYTGRETFYPSIDLKGERADYVYMPLRRKRVRWAH